MVIEGLSDYASLTDPAADADALLLGLARRLVAQADPNAEPESAGYVADALRPALALAQRGLTDIEMEAVARVYTRLLQAQRRGTGTLDPQRALGEQLELCREEGRIPFYPGAGLTSAQAVALLETPGLAALHFSAPPADAARLAVMLRKLSSTNLRPVAHELGGALTDARASLTGAGMLRVGLLVDLAIGHAALKIAHLLADEADQPLLSAANYACFVFALRCCLGRRAAGAEQQQQHSSKKGSGQVAARRASKKQRAGAAVPRMLYVNGLTPLEGQPPDKDLVSSLSPLYDHRKSGCTFLAPTEAALAVQGQAASAAFYQAAGYNALCHLGCAAALAAEVRDRPLDMSALRLLDSLLGPRLEAVGARSELSVELSIGVLAPVGILRCAQVQLWARAGGEPKHLGRPIEADPSPLPTPPSMSLTSTQWHVEDLLLGSLNTLYWGMPKVWLLAPNSEAAAKFRALLASRDPSYQDRFYAKEISLADLSIPEVLDCGMVPIVQVRGSGGREGCASETRKRRPSLARARPRARPQAPNTGVYTGRGLDSMHVPVSGGPSFAVSANYLFGTDLKAHLEYVDATGIEALATGAHESNRAILAKACQ